MLSSKYKFCSNPHKLQIHFLSVLSFENQVLLLLCHRKRQSLVIFLSVCLYPCISFYGLKGNEKNNIVSCNVFPNKMRNIINCLIKKCI